MVFKVLWLLLLGLRLENGLSSSSKRPGSVNIGAIISFNSTIGKVAKVAIQAAVDDINSSPQVLHGTKLNISMQDCCHSGFLGIVGAMTFMETQVVAIIGPQSSMIAQVISQISKGLQVPMLSFSATDPTLSSLQHPFFVRTTLNDLFQMAAIADIVDYFGWREVTAIYTDDNYGRNGIAALGDKLSEKQCRISYRAPMRPELNREDITNVLFEASSQESRIFVLHTYDSYGLEILDVARSLLMLGNGYVWIATSWLTDVLDTESALSPDALSNIQGLLTLRAHTPDSQVKMNFLGQWRNLVRRDHPDDLFGLNIYGLYAYDTVWILAHALDAYFSQGGNITFSYNFALSQLKHGNLHLDTMGIFDGGRLLLSDILKVNITGLAGRIQFNSDRNLNNPAFDIINVVGTGLNTIGYWSNSSSISAHPPEAMNNSPVLPNSGQPLSGVIWPGLTADKPRGWVFSSNGKVLRIAVPKRFDYGELITYSASTNTFTGYCIDMFNAAVNLVPYAVPYTLIPYGSGKDNPEITELIEKISAGVFDAIVGDITITTNRTRMADFTQPYTASGLVVVAPVQTEDTGAWAFTRPFTPVMWCVTSVSFVVLGAVIWIVEHRLNDEFRGSPLNQVTTTLWFSCSALFFLHRQNLTSALGRTVLIIWLFAILIIKSSYTACLTSVLMVRQLSSPVKGIESLVESKDPIGYQEGSFVGKYLHENLHIQNSRLVALRSEDEYAAALRKGPRNGGVAAVVDEEAYMNLFLSRRCEFAIRGQEFARKGWGFVFPRDSPLAVDISTAILKLSENGDLQRFHDKWLTRRVCSSQNTELAVDSLHLKSFWGLFFICGIAFLLALLVYFTITARQLVHEKEAVSSNRISRSSCLRPSLTSSSETGLVTRSQFKKRKMENATTLQNSEIH